MSFDSSVPSTPATLVADVGPFEKIGTSTIDGLTGRVFLSPHAFYLVKVEPLSAGHGIVASLLNEVGRLPNNDVRTCCVGDLADGVRLGIDPRSEFVAKDVVVLPRGVVRRINVPWFNNLIEVFVGSDDRFAIVTGLFAVGKVNHCSPNTAGP
jgi:hypothetical protein